MKLIKVSMLLALGLCQSLAAPLLAEYWHMGAIIILFSRLNLPSDNGENSFDIINPHITDSQPQLNCAVGVINN